MRHLAKKHEKGNGMKNARVGLLVALTLMMTVPAFAAPDQEQIEKGAQGL